MGGAQLAGHLPEQVDVSVAIFDLVISNAPGALLPTDDPHLLDLSCVQTYQGENTTSQTLFIMMNKKKGTDTSREQEIVTPGALESG